MKKTLLLKLNASSYIPSLMLGSLLLTGCAKLVSNYDTIPSEKELINRKDHIDNQKYELYSMVEKMINGLVPFNNQMNPLFYQDSERNTLIHDAALKNNPSLMKTYLASSALKEYDEYNEHDKKVNGNSLLNRKNNKGDTPFYIAAANGSLEVVKLLVDRSTYPAI